MASECGKYVIGGVTVSCPYKPYPGQMSMMDKVIKSLQRSQGSLLESPTGSGKSLALLCASLAWQRSEYEKSAQEAATNATPELRKKRSNDHREGDSDTEDFKTPPPQPQSVAGASGTAGKASDTTVSGATEPKRRRVPRIFYGTRTHNQITQLIGELRKTMYDDTKITILSSREHTCINDDVRNSSAGKNEACKELLLRQSGSGCRYFSKLKSSYDNPAAIRAKLAKHATNASAFDIEDMTKTGGKCGFCPYFATTRVLLQDAQLVFCPYNYLIDPVIRRSMAISFQGEVVIIDEAHNMEDSCREAVSFHIEYDALRSAERNFEELVVMDMEPKLNGPLRQLCRSVRIWIEEQMAIAGLLRPHPRDSEGFKKYYVWSGAETIKIFEDRIRCNGQMLESLWKIMGEITAEESEGRKDDSKLKPHSASMSVIERILFFLGYLYKDEYKFQDDFKMCLMQETVYNRRQTTETTANESWLSKRRNSAGPSFGGGLLMDPNQELILHFWCFNPAVAFSDLGDIARSVILASGTLSPMSTFQSELGYKFPLQLEASHIIPKSRAWVGTLGQGPERSLLRVTYDRMYTAGFQDEIGQIITDICESIPSGILCFFSSYKIMLSMVNRWEVTGQMESIRRVKQVISEPKRSDDLKKSMKQFYKAIRRPKLFGQSCTGSLFLAVCRGKVSEGLDFADANARAVVTIGIPYPSLLDLQVELKKNYNNQFGASKGLLSGSEWYEIQAYRAINQALGRCLRHRNDWAALILIDSRFSEQEIRRPENGFVPAVRASQNHLSNRYTKGLSKWVQKFLLHYRSYDQMFDTLKPFIDKMSSEVPIFKAPPTGDVDTVFDSDDDGSEASTHRGQPLKAKQARSSAKRRRQARSQYSGAVGIQRSWFSALEQNDDKLSVTRSGRITCKRASPISNGSIKDTGNSVTRKRKSKTFKGIKHQMELMSQGLSPAAVDMSPCVPPLSQSSCFSSLEGISVGGSAIGKCECVRATDSPSFIAQDDEVVDFFGRHAAGSIEDGDAVLSGSLLFDGLRTSTQLPASTSPRTDQVQRSHLSSSSLQYPESPPMDESLLVAVNDDGMPPDDHLSVTGASGASECLVGDPSPTIVRHPQALPAATASGATPVIRGQGGNGASGLVGSSQSPLWHHGGVLHSEAVTPNGTLDGPSVSQLAPGSKGVKASGVPLESEFPSADLHIDVTANHAASDRDVVLCSPPAAVVVKSSCGSEMSVDAALKQLADIPSIDCNSFRNTDPTGNSDDISCDGIHADGKSCRPGADCCLPNGTGGSPRPCAGEFDLSSPPLTKRCLGPAATNDSTARSHETAGTDDCEADIEDFAKVPNMAVSPEFTIVKSKLAGTLGEDADLFVTKPIAVASPQVTTRSKKRTRLSLGSSVREPCRSSAPDVASHDVAPVCSSTLKASPSREDSCSGFLCCNRCGSVIKSSCSESVTVPADELAFLSDEVGNLAWCSCLEKRSSRPSDWQMMNYNQWCLLTEFNGLINVDIFSKQIQMGRDSAGSIVLNMRYDPERQTGIQAIVCRCCSLLSVESTTSNQQEFPLLPIGFRFISFSSHSNCLNNRVVVSSGARVCLSYLPQHVESLTELPVLR